MRQDKKREKCLTASLLLKNPDDPNCQKHQKCTESKTLNLLIYLFYASVKMHQNHSLPCLTLSSQLLQILFILRFSFSNAGTGVSI